MYRCFLVYMYPKTVDSCSCVCRGTLSQNQIRQQKQRMRQDIISMRQDHVRENRERRCLQKSILSEEKLSPVSAKEELGPRGAAIYKCFKYVYHFSKNSGVKVAPGYEPIRPSCGS